MKSANGFYFHDFHPLEYNRRMSLIFEDQTRVLRRCFFDVHNEVGVGYPEEAYHRAFVACCQKRGIAISSKQSGRLNYHETLVHTFQYDVLAYDEILLELKALPGGFAQENYFQIISYLKFWKKSLGLLVNFGQERVKVERVPYAEKPLVISEDYEHLQPWLMKEIAKSAWNVTRIILDPRLPVSPVLVRFKPSQKSQVGLTTHANSITLTPAGVWRSVPRSASVPSSSIRLALCVPALYGEAFGLYVIEALASGVPVVQPRHAAFPELIEATGGGALYEPGNLSALVQQLEDLLLNPILARSLGTAGRKAVLEKFSVDSMAQEMVKTIQEVL